MSTTTGLQQPVHDEDVVGPAVGVVAAHRARHPALPARAAAHRVHRVAVGPLPPPHHPIQTL